MQTLPQTQPSTFEALVDRLAVELMTAHPADAERISRAAEICKTPNSVERTAQGGWLVSSQSSKSPAMYSVTSSGCHCCDAARRDARGCKHWFATVITQQIERDAVDAEQADGCIDCEDGGRESPEGMRRRCSNCPLTATWTDADRERGYQCDPDAPIGLELSGAGWLAVVLQGEPFDMELDPTDDAQDDDDGTDEWDDQGEHPDLPPAPPAARIGITRLPTPARLQRFADELGMGV